MSALDQVNLLRISANENLDPQKRGALGQFFTSEPVAQFMASLFSNLNGDIRCIDPGCGPGSLSAAFTDEVVRRGNANSLHLTAYDVEPVVEPFINEALVICERLAKESGLVFHSHFHLEDFILQSSRESGLFADEKFTHCIINPPYKKISSTSVHSKVLLEAGIDTVNLYSAFVALTIEKLVHGGEMVMIVPRSFCNGPYYRHFRHILLTQTAIIHVHIFDSRNNAFSGDQVLQENVILHVVKGGAQSDITITSSPGSDFFIDTETNSITASDMTIRRVNFGAVVKPEDKDRFIHIAANDRDQAYVDRMSLFTSTLEEIFVRVSTGPVVDFRLKNDLRNQLEDGAVPLLYPVHLSDGVNWPKDSKKPNAIFVSEESKPWLWANTGYFVLVRRFSSKEEKRRIVATVYDGLLPGELVGFDNKLNVFHVSKRGLARDLAYGLYIYLNSSLLDKYYRLFGGHTQVNATDLRNIHYPDTDALVRMGRCVKGETLTQDQIDTILAEEINKMAGKETVNPLDAQRKLDEALAIIAALGMPKAQQNERSALTLLALLDLRPDVAWKDISRPMIGVTPIMDWARDVYGKEYAPNTRETFRRQTLHQFVDGGLCLYNPDQPNRPVNSPKACYQIATDLFEVLSLYGTSLWEGSLAKWLKSSDTLVQQYAMAREMEMIPLTLDDGTTIRLSPGEHSKLIHDIVEDFGPRFAPGSEVIYLGDTGAKEDFFKKERLAEFGVTVDRKGKLPDVVLYWPEKDWLLLIESVTSHGPVDGKRHAELAKLFTSSKPGLVYVTAFPNKKIMGKYLSDISWETEVWISDAPSHMIHFNGDRFLGPH
mgnify:CR=1 FL=1|tara:strand:- start:6018 stop:8501 length:2484 start_codon:yes stop_codon:yes gene_type:complete